MTSRSGGAGGVVAVFDPSPVLTITVETSPTGADEIHVHAGGQGVWVARMIAGLGGRPILCCAVGGETGRVVAELATAESIEVRQVSGPEPTGAYVHDRREGERQVVAGSFPPPLDRHRVDDLFGMTLTTALETGACVLAGPKPEAVVPPGVYRRLCRSLTEQGVAVVADLSREALAAALEAEPTTVRVNVEQLREVGLVADTSDRAVLAAMDQLQRRGVSSVVVSRGSEPAAGPGRRRGDACPVPSPGAAGSPRHRGSDRPSQHPTPRGRGRGGTGRPPPRSAVCRRARHPGVVAASVGVPSAEVDAEGVRRRRAAPRGPGGQRTVTGIAGS